MTYTLIGLVLISFGFIGFFIYKRYQKCKQKRKQKNAVVSRFQTLAGIRPGEKVSIASRSHLVNMEGLPDDEIDIDKVLLAAIEKYKT